MPSTHQRSPQRHPRFRVRVPLRISTIDPEIDPATGGPCFSSCEETSGNLSVGGVCVERSDGLTPGRRVLVEVDLPDGPTIQTLGRVAWSRIAIAGSRDTTTPGVGIEFTGSRRVDIQALSDYLGRHALRSRKRTNTTSQTPRHATP